MKKCLAIDIALLPPDEVMDIAITINKQHGPKINLNKTNRLPHITLSQAIIDMRNLGLAKKPLKKIASEFKPLKLKAIIINEPDTFFEVLKTKELTELHTKIMDSFEDLVSYDVKSKYYYDDFIREHTLAWVRDFRKLHAHKNFSPHISLGVTAPVLNQEKIDFIASRLVICHLGNYNTCRRILYETKLGL